MGQNNRRYRKVVFYISEKGMKRNRRKIFGEGKHNFFKEKEKETNIWRTTVLFFWPYLVLFSLPIFMV